MKTNKLAFLPLLFKLSFLSLFCFAILESVAPINALAGNAPVALPESGSSSLGNNFSGSRELEATASSSHIRNGIADLLFTLQQRQVVASLRGRTLPISADKIEVIAAAASINSSRHEIEALEQQLMSEMGGLEIDISVVETSSRHLATSIESSNELIRSLNGTQLAATIDSPTFIAILHMQRAGREALSDGNATPERSNEAMALLQMSLR